MGQGSYNLKMIQNGIRLVIPCQGRKRVTQFINKLINYKGVCRTAPTEPGLFKNCMIKSQRSGHTKTAITIKQREYKKVIQVNSMVCDLYIMKIYSCNLSQTPVGLSANCLSLAPINHAVQFFFQFIFSTTMFK